MTSIIITSATPLNLVGLSPVSQNIIQTAGRILTYYRGGKDVLDITKRGDNYYVYIPTFSTYNGTSATNDLTGVMEDLVKEIASLGLDDGEPFLFDVKQKKILEQAAFYDFIPYNSIKNAIFMIEDDKGVIQKPVYYISNPIDYGIMQTLPLMVARRELYMPRGREWTKTGKQLLAFLVSDRYGIPHAFNFDSGPWDAVSYSLTKPTDHRAVNLEALDCTRALELSATINPMDEYPVAPFKEDDRLLLSDLIQVGVDSFFNGRYDKPIEFEVDLMKETYKSVTLDPLANICFIGLQPGVEISLSQLREDLQSENVQILA